MNTKHYLTVIFLVFTYFLSVFYGYAQSSSEEIQIERKGNRYFFTQNDKDLSLNQLLKITKEIREAQRHIEKAIDMQIASVPLGIVGGSCVGWAIGEMITSAIKKEDVRTKIVLPLFVAGGGLIIIGFCLEASAKNNSKKGVELFNNEIEQKKKANIYLGVSPSGVMLKYHF